jgi:hypothetical protein
MKEEHRLRVLQNGVLRKIFGCEREEATGDWSKLHNEEMYALMSPPSVTRVMTSRTNWRGMWHEWGRRGIPAGFWCGNVK